MLPMMPKMAMPKSPAGGPSGPGASPMMSPGSGAGTEATAMADISAIIPVLMKSMNSFPVGDKRQVAVLRAVQSLVPHFGQSNMDELMPAAAQRIGAAAKSGMGLQGHNMPPPGIALPGPAPMGQGGGGGAGMPGMPGAGG